jgi:hypothetical protein
MQTPHCFGEYDNLFGVHCQSVLSDVSVGNRPTQKVAVLMLTAGMLTSVGPSRLHVALAEKLSRKGLPSFRFDLSGIGESLAVGSQGASLERASLEVRQAIDMLEKEYGYTCFILFGLCSGADDAIVSASEDKRIIGACLMDACGYKTLGYLIPFLRRKYLPKILSVAKWFEAIGQRFSIYKPTASTMPQGFDLREFPNRIQAEDSIVALNDRGVRLQFIYTGGVIDYYSYANQFFDMFPRLRNRPEISVQFQPRWDHVTMLREDQSELLEMIVPWFESTAKSTTTNL